MAKKNPESDMLEIRVVMEPSEVEKLAQGEVVEIGALSFGTPVVISLEKRQSHKAKVAAKGKKHGFIK